MVDAIWRQDFNVRASLSNQIELFCVLLCRPDVSKDLNSSWLESGRGHGAVAPFLLSFIIWGCTVSELK